MKDRIEHKMGLSKSHTTDRQAERGTEPACLCGCMFYGLVS